MPPHPVMERQALGVVDERAEQVLVPMRDGVRLATDVYLPPNGRRSPSILVRLPYDKSGRFSFMDRIASAFVDRGFAFVAQDVRGKARSEGETFAFVHEVADGTDTIDWIAAQRWSDGAVGMFGDSYYGFTQWAAAVGGHPALRAIVPRMTTTEIGTDWMYHGGVFCLFTMVEWAAQTWIDRWLYEGVPDLSARPLAEAVPRSHGGRRSASLDRWMVTPPDDPFWAHGIFGASDPLAGIGIPVLHSGGWWDVFQRGQLRDHARLRVRVRGQHLVMGSTDHFDDELVEDGEPVADILQSEAALTRFVPGYVGPALSFFDRYLRDRSEPVPDVRWHLANEGWRVAGRWPPEEARALRLFAADAGNALRDADGGSLAAAPDTRATPVGWTHDPADPVPDLIVDAWRPLLGLPDERRVESRPDVLTFTGDATGSPLDLAGPISVAATVTGGPPTFPVVAKLVDVYPEGRARRIAQGAALAHSGAPVEIDLGSAGYRVRPGHRLRLEIAASDVPRYLPDPGSGEDPWLAGTGRPDGRSVGVGGHTGLSLTLTVLGAPDASGPFDVAGDRRGHGRGAGPPAPNSSGSVRS